MVNTPDTVHNLSGFGTNTEVSMKILMAQYQKNQRKTQTEDFSFPSDSPQTTTTDVHRFCPRFRFKISNDPCGTSGKNPVYISSRRVSRAGGGGGGGPYVLR